MHGIKISLNKHVIKLRPSVLRQILTTCTVFRGVFSLICENNCYHFIQVVELDETGDSFSIQLSGLIYLRPRATRLIQCVTQCWQIVRGHFVYLFPESSGREPVLMPFFLFCHYVPGVKIRLLLFRLWSGRCFIKIFRVIWRLSRWVLFFPFVVTPSWKTLSRQENEPLKRRRVLLLFVTDDE